MAQKPGKFIVGYDGLIPIQGWYYEGDLSVPLESNPWLGTPDDNPIPSPEKPRKGA
jgi:hypothetical protein